ncbi:MAG: DnaJ domain-containing protein [Rickettsiales bacterium]|jgi:curved DNA-binding protein CbpA|nr:DnaJ domain-containing protein [Rickettsiales bacterium]
MAGQNNSNDHKLVSFKESYLDKLRSYNNEDLSSLPYDVLDVKENASKEEIKDHFNLLSHALKDDSRAMDRIRKAYKTLSNDKSRAEYDRKVSHVRGEKEPPNHYNTLGINYNQFEIYDLEAALKVANKASIDNPEKIKKNQEAYNTLSNPDKKREYDRIFTAYHTKQEKDLTASPKHTHKELKSQQKEATRQWENKEYREKHASAYNEVKKRRKFLSRMKRKLMGEYISKHEGRAIDMVARGMEINKAMSESQKKNKGRSR